MFVILMTIPALIGAQEWHNMSNAAVDSILHPQLLPGCREMVHFDSIVTNIGQLTEDDRPVRVDFHFRNVGESPLVITRLRTDCGCTSAKADKMEYAIGGRGVVSIEYNPKNHPGTIDAATFVYSSMSDIHPVAKLTILGEVLPGSDVWDRYRYTIGTLKLKRTEVRFSFHGEKVLTERILCGNSGKTDIRIWASHLPGFITVRTEPEVIAPGGEADMVIRVERSGLTDDVRIPLQLEGIPSDNGEEKIILAIELNKKD